VNFDSIEYSGDDKILTIRMKGHPSDVIQNAHALANSVLALEGRWRFTTVEGSIREDEYYDSNMQWHIIAEVKR